MKSIEEIRAITNKAREEEYQSLLDRYTNQIAEIEERIEQRAVEGYDLYEFQTNARRLAEVLEKYFVGYTISSTSLPGLSTLIQVSWKE